MTKVGHDYRCPEDCGHGVHWYDMSPLAQELYKRHNPGQDSFYSEKARKMVQRPYLIACGFLYWEALAVHFQFKRERTEVTADVGLGRDHWFTPAQFEVLRMLLKRGVVKEDCPSENHWNYVIYSLKECPEWLRKACHLIILPVTTWEDLSEDATTHAKTCSICFEELNRSTRSVQMATSDW